MIKLNLILLFTITLINSSTYIKAINNTIKEKIEHAIKKSKPNLLNQYLSKLNLTQTEKDNFIELANSILEMRKTKMQFNFISPKKNPGDSGLWSVISGIIIGGLGTANLCCYFFSTLSSDAGQKAILYGTGGLVLATLLIASGINDIKKDETFRTRKQKYLDAIKIKQLLNTITLDKIKN